MTNFRDVTSQSRYEQGFMDADGAVRIVFADYIERGDTRVITHVEADPVLRGSGASGRFMQALSEYARSEGLKLLPTCGYAKAWLDRHVEYRDIQVG